MAFYVPPPAEHIADDQTWICVQGQVGASLVIWRRTGDRSRRVSASGRWERKAGDRWWKTEDTTQELRLFLYAEGTTNDSAEQETEGVKVTFFQETFSLMIWNGDMLEIKW